MDALVEPDDSIEVQVVGGLVQQQQRGLHEQRPGRGQPRAGSEGETLLRGPEQPQKVEPETMNILPNLSSEELLCRGHEQCARRERKSLGRAHPERESRQP